MNQQVQINTEGLREVVRAAYIVAFIVAFANLYGRAPLSKEEKLDRTLLQLGVAPNTREYKKLTKELLR